MESAQGICTRAVWVTAGWWQPHHVWQQNPHSGRRSENVCMCMYNFFFFISIYYSYHSYSGDPRPCWTGVVPKASGSVCWNFSLLFLATGPVDRCRDRWPFTSQWGWNAALLPFWNSTGILERFVGESLCQVRWYHIREHCLKIIKKVPFNLYNFSFFRLNGCYEALEEEAIQPKP